jgi:nucleotide-binding universal stress UspA family protein
MFRSIVVGTDGSDTAAQAVRQSIELARSVGARIDLVSAYEPVTDPRLHAETTNVPEDLQWMINPREDVEATLERAARAVREAIIREEVLASTSPRSAAATSSSSATRA